MREHLEREAKQRGLGNVVTVASGWEEAEVAPHDVVLCSHVLYPITDVVPFIEKLDARTKRTCVVTIRVDQLAPELSPLWHEVWGEARPPEPGLLDLYNVLFALGVRANVRLAPFVRPGPFEDLGEAIARIRQLLFLPSDDHEHDGRIGRVLEGTLVPRGGRLTWPATQQAGIVWWEKQP